MLQKFVKYQIAGIGLMKIFVLAEHFLKQRVISLKEIVTIIFTSL
jgi:hypothetical protein